MQLKPKSILEIGTGFGKYGFLFREYLDIWNAAANPSQLKPENWQVRIDGIEIFEPYIGELQRMIYNHLYIGDATTVIDELGTYDLIFLGDVIEHFPKEEGRRLLHKCLEHAQTAVIVTTPNYFNPQGAEYGNERETHHCLWTDEDFAQFPNTDCFVIEGRYNLAIMHTGVPAPKAEDETPVPEPEFSFDS